MNFLINKRKWLLLAIDFAVYSIVFFATVCLQYYSSTAKEFNLTASLVNYLIFAFFIFAARFALRNYSNVWRYANSLVFLKMVVADIVGGVAALILTYILKQFYLGIWLILSTITMCNVATLVTRFAYQEMYKRSRLGSKENSESEKINVAIVGAGQAGYLLADELLCNKKSQYRPVCFIDRDKEKVGSRVLGLVVHGDDNTVYTKLSSLQVKEIFIALPKISSERTKALNDFYSAAGYKVKLYALPIDDSENKGENKRVLRELRIEDLLFRNGLEVADSNMPAFYRDKVVLVTGGGGSIGSELCRQIAKCSPKKLIIFDIYENNAYDIEQELIRSYGKRLNLQVEIGSVRDVARLDAVFSNYRPDMVFHAAAHKHVPLMEHSNAEAVKNNVMGTYNTANMAEKYGTKKFILISTDKAVNPTNVMGASKRMCEMVVQCRVDSATTFSAVRFGNVLGSNGSVIPLFKRQIEAGGPLTITDKRVIRYFMTIPEAAGLVMQAGAMAKRNELFVLDMGKPIKIVDLAENMIKLSGLVPYRDIDIQEIGLRPGEKLYEELLMKTENLDKTENDTIFIERDAPLTREEVEEKLRILCDAVRENEGSICASAIKEAMMAVVPTFRPPEVVNSKAQNSEEMRLASTV